MSADSAEVVRTRTIRLLEYLSAVRALREQPVRDIAEYRDKLWWTADIPVHPSCTVTTEGEAPWLTVSKAAVPTPPSCPEEAADFLRRPITDPDVPPAFPPEFDSWFEDSPEEAERLRVLLDAYVEGPWSGWAEKARVALTARRLYEDLYDLRLRLQRDEALLELVWGHGILSWTVEGQRVTHPLVTTRVQLSFDSLDGSISVEPESLSPQLEIDHLQGLDLKGFDLLIDLRERFRTDPTGPWDSGVRNLYEQYMAPLGLDGHLLDAERPPAPTVEPVITTGWALFVRRRSTMYQRFFGNLRDALLSGEVDVPAPLAAVVADEPSVLEYLDAGPQAEEWLRTAEQLLMPLPANAEQEAIARRLAEHRGVTVQGPPGTGKTHTIANLVSHLVGHGKRVLVTSQKEQALSVLRDKIPESIRNLSVAVLGNSATSLAQLDQSVQAIYEQAVGLDRPAAMKHVESLESLRNATQREIAALRSRIETAISREKDSYSLGPTTHTPSTLARWIRETSAELSFIPDEVARNVDPPLNEREAAELYRLAAALDRADCAEATKLLPEPGELPRGQELFILAEELRELRDRLANTEYAVHNASAYRALGAEGASRLIEMVDRTSRHLHNMEQPWLMAIRHELGNPAFAATWRDQAKAIKEGIEDLALIRGTLLGHTVLLPQSGMPSKEFVSQLQEIKDRYSAGKGLSRLLHRELCRVRDECLVDEEPPTTASEVDLCLLETRARRRRYELINRWNGAVGRIEGPLIDPNSEYPEFIVDEHVNTLSETFNWEDGGRQEFADRLQAAGISLPERTTAQWVGELANTLRVATGYFRAGEIAERIDNLRAALEAGADSPRASKWWTLLLDALNGANFKEWDGGLVEVTRLRELTKDADRLDELCGRLSAAAPMWALAIRDTKAEPSACGTAGKALEAWEWRKADVWLRNLIEDDDPATLQRQLESKLRNLNELTGELAAASAWLAVSERLTDAERRALTAWAQALRKVGKGTGKYAGRWRAVAQSAMVEAQTAVPVWIMPAYRVVESFDPTRAAFDVVIVDESSQCDIFAMAALGIARKAVVVGDDKQISPQTVGIDESRVHDLIDLHIPDLPHADLLDIKTSLYDLSKMRFPGVITLREHFRCLPEIIEFSNQLAYGGDILPLREQLADSSWKSVLDVHVPDGYREGGTDTNPPEAEYIADRIVDLCADPRYDERTIGVISMLGDGQAQLIESLLIDRLGEQEMERRRIRCGNAYHFQGDERHVMFLSMVVASGDGRRIGAMTKESDTQRMNVAASRAQDQMWCIRSVPTEELHPNDVRARFIRYCQNPNLVDHSMEVNDGLFDSDFERDVYRHVIARGYRVKVQYRVGRFKIDMVIQGRKGRLALELDGDAYHGPDRWQADRSRQAILERLGWTFHRIRGSAYYRDPDAALATLWDRLETLGIRPPGDDDETLAVAAAPLDRAKESSAERQRAVPVSTADVADDASIQIREQAREDSPRQGGQPGQPARTARHAPQRAHGDRTVLPPAAEANAEPRAKALKVLYGKQDSGRTARTPAPAKTQNADQGPYGLAQFESWSIRKCPTGQHVRQEQMIDILVDIVAAEGPVVAERVYRLYCKGTGAIEVDPSEREALQKAVYAAVRLGKLGQIDDDVAGRPRKTLYLPGTPPVVPRRRGPRKLEEIPRTEVAALAEVILERTPRITDGHLRALLLKAYEVIDARGEDRYLDEGIALARGG